MLNGFKEFILRGNVVELAVAVVVGTAFTALVNALVDSVFNPLIGALFNADDLTNALDVTITLTAGNATLKFGAVIAAIIQFVLVAAVIYFCVVLPLNKLKEMTDRKKAKGLVEEAAAPTELELLAEIRDLLSADGTKRESRH
ncbi:large conductance mechanosensitive channel protein MscL [Mycetocola reblochoni]|uniref:Large-conductance mechanosensitive channel n=2 Tax=Mycetocola reblochoni TaxID=331618 RepID=A0A1R4IQQ6_9MICO|nr:large conductance mechanosensitive channel protein MscL [Mycetocola reblochoni]RLP68418.1 large conductance mechanosensitive channel protein MscL [Mycetocola reblochoni]SJN21915.1 Large-conductance mechanosensitive channel [Mycetocola reblochoni REB411]